MIRIYFPLLVNGADRLLAVGCLLRIQLQFWQKQETVWPKQWRLGKKSARFDDPAKTKGRPREGSVTRKGREGPAARAAKTHRGDVLKRLLEKLADSTHHHLKGKKKKNKFRREVVSDQKRRSLSTYMEDVV